jgi:transposase
VRGPVAGAFRDWVPSRRRRTSAVKRLGSVLQDAGIKTGLVASSIATRGRSGDLEYGIKGLLVRNLEHLSPAQFAKVMDTLSGSRDGQEILAAWIAKEKLRDALRLRAAVTGSTPSERAVRGRLFAFCDWCARNDDIPELLSLAKTISRWEQELAAAVVTGLTNARSESLNRLAKLEARQAYGFRNPASQRRTVRVACTRGRRRPRPVKHSRSRLVTGRKHDPG